jgi:hypothetical protein
MRSFHVLSLTTLMIFAAHAYGQTQIVSDLPAATVISQSGPAPTVSGTDTSIPDKIQSGTGNVRQSPAVADDGR